MEEGVHGCNCCSGSNCGEGCGGGAEEELSRGRLVAGSC